MNDYFIGFFDAYYMREKPKNPSVDYEKGWKDGEDGLSFATQPQVELVW